MRQLLIIGLLAVSGQAVAAPAPENLLHADFEDQDLRAWRLGGDGDARVTAYAGNHSLRLLGGAEAITTVGTAGYSTVSIAAAFAAYRLAPHDLCVAEYSLDGKRWRAVVTVRPGQDDGIALHPGQARNLALQGAASITLRLRAQLSDPQGACWADNIDVLGVKA